MLCWDQTHSIANARQALSQTEAYPQSRSRSIKWLASDREALGVSDSEASALLPLHAAGTLTGQSLVLLNILSL